MSTRNFGNPAEEYEAARNGAAYVLRTDRALLRVYGRDPSRIVQGIITNDVTLANDERVVYGALLTPKGRMVADVRVVRRGADLLLDVPALALDALLDLFKRTIPPLFARFENVTASFAMLGVYGANATLVLANAGIDATDMRSEDALKAVDETLVMTTRDTGSTGYDIITPVAAADEMTGRLVAAGAVRIGEATLDVLRIEAGTPRWGAELDETTIPLEADLLARAIATNKGCYTGQEVIIRVLHRGHVNWHLRGVLIGDSPTPARGAQIVDAALKKIGRITSAAWSPLHNQTIALAYVRREVNPPADAFLETDTNPLHIVSLPFSKRDGS